MLRLSVAVGVTDNVKSVVELFPVNWSLVIVTPAAADNLNIFISGVYQNSLDSSGTANYTVAGTTLTFATAPPTTAANGIEVVITE